MKKVTVNCTVYTCNVKASAAYQGRNEVKRQSQLVNGTCYRNPLTKSWEMLSHDELIPNTQIVDFTTYEIGKEPTEHYASLIENEPINYWLPYDYDLNVKATNKTIAVEIASLPKDWIELTDGKFLLKDFGKYASNLLIISSFPELLWEKLSAQDLNFSFGDFARIKGDFFTTKKGAKAFKVDRKGQHYLVRDNWGGAFNDYRGEQLNNLTNHYYRRARSNGGGSGYDYTIINVNTVNSVSIDDL